MGAMKLGRHDAGDGIEVAPSAELALVGAVLVGPIVVARASLEDILVVEVEIVDARVYLFERAHQTISPSRIREVIFTAQQYRKQSSSNLHQRRFNPGSEIM